MNSIYILPKDVLGEMLYRRIYLLVKKNRCDWAAIGATFGLVGGMLSIVLGSLLWAIVKLLVTGSPGSLLNLLESMSFVLPLPLLALGAHCLDLLEQRPPILPLLPDKSRRAVFESRHRFRPRRPNQN
ncbi:MAG TPA: hypothetical protein VF658_06680 [Pyrinomonadaceae bacterium]